MDGHGRIIWKVSAAGKRLFKVSGVYATEFL